MRFNCIIADFYYAFNHLTQTCCATFSNIIGNFISFGWSLITPNTVSANYPELRLGIKNKGGLSYSSLNAAIDKSIKININIHINCAYIG